MSLAAVGASTLPSGPVDVHSQETQAAYAVIQSACDACAASIYSKLPGFVKDRTEVEELSNQSFLYAAGAYVAGKYDRSRHRLRSWAFSVARRAINRFLLKESGTIATNGRDKKTIYKKVTKIEIGQMDWEDFKDRPLSVEGRYLASPGALGQKRLTPEGQLARNQRAASAKREKRRAHREGGEL